MPLSGPMRCKHCRYDLTGLADNRCPECGEAFDPGEQPPPRSRLSRFLIASALSVPIVYVLSFIRIGIMLTTSEIGFDLVGIASIALTFTIIYAIPVTVLMPIVVGVALFKSERRST